MVAQDAAGGFFFSLLHFATPLRCLLQKPWGSAVGNPNTENDGVLFKKDHFSFGSFVALAVVQL